LNTGIVPEIMQFHSCAVKDLTVSQSTVRPIFLSAQTYYAALPSIMV